MKNKVRRKKMLYVYIALGLVAGVVLIDQGGGMLLPVGHTASLSRLMPAAPQKVWEALTDIENHPNWRSELISIHKTGDEPLSWIEKSKFGEMPLRVEVFEPEKRLVARIDSKDLPFGGTWTYRLEPKEGGTQLTITEDGEVRPPAFRFLSKFVFGHTKTIESYLSQLEAHLKKEAS